MALSSEPSVTSVSSGCTRCPSHVPLSAFLIGVADRAGPATAAMGSTSRSRMALRPIAPTRSEITRSPPSTEKNLLW